MGILNELLARVQSVEDGLETGNFVRDALISREGDILELQKIQLLQGLNSSGQEIHPFYSEDLKPSGYFYSVESAGRYAAWKESLNYPYSVERNPDAPNLYITGKFHDELGVQFGPAKVAVIGQTGYAKGIVAKYGLSTFGLMMPNWMLIMRERGALEEIMNTIKQQLYGN